MNLFAMFPPFPRKDTVFVAMSFDKRFNQRWQNIIQPGIRRVAIGGKRLEAVRVDQRNISDSIMTEILLEISHARLVLADISSVGKLEDKTIRNGNVMYEVGLAQAVRLPEEVILLRSDNDDLLFDVRGVRVIEYSPEDDPEGAVDFVAGLVAEALKEVDLAKTLAVKEALDKLDFQCWYLLAEGLEGVIRQPVVRTVRDAVSYGATRIPALLRLLDLGLVRMRCEGMTPAKLCDGGDRPSEELFTYEITEFGLAVMKAYGIACGIHKLPRDLMESLEAKFSDRTKGEGEGGHNGMKVGDV